MMNNDPEKSPSGVENNIEMRKASSDQIEKLINKPESSVELSPRDIESRAEKARLEALENAASVESTGVEKEKKPKNNSVPIRRGSMGKKERNKSFSQTIGQAQKEMSAVSRTFSKIIHNKAIENTSNVIGNTIARPNAILSGAVVAFVLTLLTYTTAKTLGYRLSGFETIAAFVIGWIIGVIYDYLKVLFTGKK